MLAGDRADIDDATAAGREVLQCFLDGQDWPQDVRVELAIELLGLVESNTLATSCFSR